MQIGSYYLSSLPWKKSLNIMGKGRPFFPPNFRQIIFFEVGARLLSKEKARVVRLHMRDQDHTEFKFQKFNAHNAQVTTYYCHECGKVKNYKDGYYVSDKRSPQSCVFCVQCAAKRAESNLKYFQTRCHNHYMDSDSLKQVTCFVSP